MRGGAGLGQAEVGRVDVLGARAVSDVRASRATQEHQALGPVDVLGAHVSAVFGPALCPAQGEGDGAVGAGSRGGWGGGDLGSVEWRAVGDVMRRLLSYHHVSIYIHI